MPLASALTFKHDQNLWDGFAQADTDTCIKQQFANPAKDTIDCMRNAGVYKTVFEHEHVTPGRYWSNALTTFFIADLLITALLAAAFFVVRWIVRGFRLRPAVQKPDSGAGNLNHKV